MNGNDFKKALDNLTLNGDVVWRSELTKSMVAHLTDDEFQQLVDALDDAVFHTCQEFGGVASISISANDKDR